MMNNTTPETSNTQVSNAAPETSNIGVNVEEMAAADQINLLLMLLDDML